MFGTGECGVIFEEDMLREGAGLCSLDPREFSGPSPFLSDCGTGALMMTAHLYAEARFGRSGGRGSKSVVLHHRTGDAARGPRGGYEDES